VTRSKRGQWLLRAAAVGVAAVSAVAGLPRRGSPTQGLDRRGHERARSWAARRPARRRALRILSQLGHSGIAIPVSLGTAVQLARRGRHHESAFVATATAASYVISRVAGRLIDRPRPPQPMWPASGPSMPSGHVTNAATMGAVAVALTWPHTSNGQRAAVLAAATGAVGVIGLVVRFVSSSVPIRPARWWGR
jgi:membrane-associated phospholipid phosphatase